MRRGLPHVRRTLFDLESHRHTGRARFVGDAVGIVEQDFAGTDLNQQRRLSLVMAVERCCERIAQLVCGIELAHVA